MDTVDFAEAAGCYILRNLNEIRVMIITFGIIVLQSHPPPHELQRTTLIRKPADDLTNRSDREGCGRQHLGNNASEHCGVLIWMTNVQCSPPGGQTWISRVKVPMGKPANARSRIHQPVTARDICAEFGARSEALPTLIVDEEGQGDLTAEHREARQKSDGIGGGRRRGKGIESGVGHCERVSGHNKRAAAERVAKEGA
ncbi:hypothetical protein B0H19DRAFT_1238377 [Mycena capillaripes]|nr:hypothetical protein B0H19DRAFT_1238377 [Mycena capillaripes]